MKVSQSIRLYMYNDLKEKNSNEKKIISNLQVLKVKITFMKLMRLILMKLGSLDD